MSVYLIWIFGVWRVRFVHIVEDDHMKPATGLVYQVKHTSSNECNFPNSTSKVFTD